MLVALVLFLPGDTVDDNQPAKIVISLGMIFGSSDCPPQYAGPIRPLGEWCPVKLGRHYFRERQIGRRIMVIGLRRYWRLNDDWQRFLIIMPVRPLEGASELADNRVEGVHQRLGVPLQQRERVV